MLKLVDPKTSLPLTDQQLLGEITLMYFAGETLQIHCNSEGMEAYRVCLADPTQDQCGVVKLGRT